MSMISAEEAASRLGVTPHTVRGWCRSGELRASQLGGRIWRIDPADLDAWVESQRPTPTTTPQPDERQLDLTAPVPVLDQFCEPANP